MLPALTANEMRSIDRHLVEVVGIPSLTLMERAAKGALFAIEDWLASDSFSSILIFAGTGKNGGDGLALGRLLHQRGVQFHVQIVGDQAKFSSETNWQYDELVARGLGNQVSAFNESEFRLKGHPPTILVDALLGTGSNGSLREPILSAVLRINALKLELQARTLSLDIPTGMNTDNGTFAITGLRARCVVLADRTATFGATKLGFYQNDAREITGEIVVVSLEAPMLGIEGIHHHLVVNGDVRQSYTKPKQSASKFEMGRVLSICGSRGMTGAAIMGGEAALRAGCGLVTIATPKSQQHIVAQAMPELMTIGIQETATGAPAAEAFDELREQFERADVLLIGSGLRPEPETAQLLLRILKEIEKPIIADAGALIALTGNTSILERRRAPTILTPNLGEFAKMLGFERAADAADRLGFARKFAMEHRVTLCTKGAPTYTISSEGEVFINSTGNVGLATAGSGDVLAGMIAGLLAQSPSEPVATTWMAVYLHGSAADFAKEEMTTLGMTATDVIRHLPNAYRAEGLE